MEALRTLRSKLEEYGLSQDVTRLEVADTEQIAFLYQDRISVLLGTLNDLDYKDVYKRQSLSSPGLHPCAPRCGVGCVRRRARWLRWAWAGLPPAWASRSCWAARVG